MDIKELEEMFRKKESNELTWNGKCHDCQEETKVVATSNGSEITISGGAVYKTQIEGDDAFFVKCDSCFVKHPTLTDFRPVECYSRVVGYYRPINHWNKAKRAEFGMRKTFVEPDARKVA